MKPIKPKSSTTEKLPTKGMKKIENYYAPGTSLATKVKRTVKDALSSKKKRIYAGESKPINPKGSTTEKLPTSRRVLKGMKKIEYLPGTSMKTKVKSTIKRAVTPKSKKIFY